jgi:hypothetical protein
MVGAEPGSVYLRFRNPMERLALDGLVPVTSHGFRWRYEYWSIRFNAPHLGLLASVVLVPTVNSWIARF